VTLTLLLGGARSGKSTLAVECGRAWPGEVTFVATAEPRDADMAARIERHRLERPDSWRLVEEPLELQALEELESARAELLIVDCLTLWLSNALEAGFSDDDVRDRAELTASRAGSRSGPVLVVTNEVGLGLVPETALGRRYRDLLGNVNALYAAAADRAFFVVAGRPLPLGPAAVDRVLPP